MSDAGRPSSSASFNKGTASTELELPRASSVEADVVFGTLPKKKKKKWHGIKKISSPFWNRRKSFSHGSSRAPSIAQTATYVPSVATTNEASDTDSSHRLSMHSMTSQTSASKLAGRSESRGESRSEEGVVSKKEVVVSPVKVHGYIPEKTAADKMLRKMCMPTPSRRGRGRDECLKALKVMTTLSSNKECLSTLISYICLPKCINK